METEPVRPTTIDTNGHILLPKWFLGFLSFVVTLLSLTMIPWAVSVTQDLNALSNELTALRTRFEGRVTLQSEVIRNVNQRMERIEKKLDQLEQRQRAGFSSDHWKAKP